MPELVEQAPIEAVGLAMAANALVMEEFIGAMFGSVSTAADSPASRYIPITIDGVDYLLLAKPA